MSKSLKYSLTSNKKFLRLFHSLKYRCVDLNVYLLAEREVRNKVNLVRVIPISIKSDFALLDIISNMDPDRVFLSITWIGYALGKFKLYDDE
jgi:hypothetical protein